MVNFISSTYILQTGTDFGNPYHSEKSLWMGTKSRTSSQSDASSSVPAARKVRYQQNWKLPLQLENWTTHIAIRPKNLFLWRVHSAVSPRMWLWLRRTQQCPADSKLRGRAFTFASLNAMKLTNNSVERQPTFLRSNY